MMRALAALVLCGCSLVDDAAADGGSDDAQDAPPPDVAPSDAPPAARAWGGAFEVSDMSVACTRPCFNANVVGGACACTSAFETPGAAIRVLNDCPGAGVPFGAFAHPCDTPLATDMTDFEGVYELDDMGACSQGCRAKNPWTAACQCPTGAMPIDFPIAVDCVGGFIGSHVVFCMRTSAPRTSFGGAFQIDDTPGECLRPNPVTNGCTCPTGAREQALRALVLVGTNMFRGATIIVCTL
jgi:hypothetical protein